MSRTVLHRSEDKTRLYNEHLSVADGENTANEMSHPFTSHEAEVFNVVVAVVSVVMFDLRTIPVSCQECLGNEMVDVMLVSTPVTTQGNSQITVTVVSGFQLAAQPCIPDTTVCAHGIVWKPLDLSPLLFQRSPPPDPTGSTAGDQVHSRYR